jgi:hypothetical protein
MPGGLMQLVGKGAQDHLVTGNPSFTHFRSMYKRHTEFAMEHIRLYFKTTKISLPQSGTIRLQTKVDRHAQLVNDCYLSVTLPDIYSPVSPITAGTHSNINSSASAIGYEFQWIRNIGYNMIRSVSVLINGQTIVSHTGEWMKLYAELKFDANKKAILDQMTGNIPELYDPANVFGRMNQYPHSISTSSSLAAPSIPGRTLLIPLHFWFCESIGASLPLIALQHSEVQIVVDLNNMYSLFTTLDVRDSSTTCGTRIAPDTSSTDFTINNFLSPPTYAVNPVPTNPTLVSWNLNPFIEANYIWLSDSELTHIAKTDHSFIVRQVDMVQANGQYGPSNDLELTMRNLCTRVVWVGQRSDRAALNDYDNYTNWPDAYKPPLDLPAVSLVPSYSSGIAQSTNISQRDILLESNIVLDGKDRFTTKQTEFFSTLPYYRHHTGQGSSGISGIYTYSFASEHDEQQPSGHINGSMFNKTVLRNTFVQPAYTAVPTTSTSVCILKSTATSSNPTIILNPNITDPNTGKRLYNPDELITVITKSNAQTFEYTFDVRAYVESYNFLRVLGGVANVVFSS